MGAYYETEVLSEEAGNVQRWRAFRVSYAYRIVSEKAVLIITGVSPIDLLIDQSIQPERSKANGEKSIYGGK